MIFHSLDTRGGQNLCAMIAGEMGDVGGGFCYVYSASGGIANGVLLGVHRALLVTFTDTRYMWRAGQEAVVAGGDDPVLLVTTGD